MYMSFAAVIALFLIWTIAEYGIAILTPRFIPYLGFFPYVQELKKFHLPQRVYSFANFDGVHYVKVAQHGYEQFEQAFFPLYPLLMKILKPVFFNNPIIAGLLISNISFLFGLWIFTKYVSTVKSQKSNVFWVVLFLLAFPSSFFFISVYTEGLFFLLVVCSLYFMQRNWYATAGIFAFLASLTRLTGVFLIIPIAFHLIYRIRSHSAMKQLNHGTISSFLNLKSLILILSPLLGLALYALYLFKTTGDPLYFFHAQPVFGSHRSTSLILLPQVYVRYIRIFLTATVDFRYGVAVFEFLVFNLVFFGLLTQLIAIFRKRDQKELLGLNLFSLANLLIPPLTGTFSSIPRYVLFSLSFFFFLAQIRSFWIKLFFTLIFAVSHVFMLAYFIQGYFVS